MSSEQLWSTGCRLLGVYFIVMAVIGLPGVLTSLGVDTNGPEPWMAWIIPVTILSQSVIGLVAGWWLLRDPPAARHAYHDRPAPLSVR